MEKVRALRSILTQFAGAFFQSRRRLVMRLVDLGRIAIDGARARLAQLPLAVWTCRILLLYPRLSHAVLVESLKLLMSKETMCGRPDEGSRRPAAARSVPE